MLRRDPGGKGGRRVEERKRGGWRGHRREKECGGGRSVGQNQH